MPSKKRRAQLHWVIFIVLAALTPIACSYCEAHSPAWLTHGAIQASFMVLGMAFITAASMSAIQFMLED